MKHLIIGGGSIGKRHLVNLYNIGETELFCFKRSYDEVFETQFHCKVITTKTEAQQAKPDILYVCNPTSQHYDGLLLAQELGTHLFMEKPLIHNEHLLKKMVAKWENKCVFFIGFVLRYHPLVKILKEKINEKVIGEVFSARFEFGSFLPNWHPEENYHEGYAARKALGGGVINTITHELDLILHLFGTPESVISAKVNQGYLKIDVEELAESIFRYPWGLATLHLDFLQKDYDRQIRILGTEGKITWNWRDNTIIINRNSIPVEVIELKDLDINQLYIDELKDFFELIRLNKTQHPLDFEYSITNTKWMMAMHKSAETQRIWEI